MPLTERANAKRSSTKEHGAWSLPVVEVEPNGYGGENDEHDDLNGKGNKKAVHGVKRHPISSLYSLLRFARWRICKNLKFTSTKHQVRATVAKLSFATFLLVIMWVSQSSFSFSLRDYTKFSNVRNRYLPKRQLVIQRPDSIEPMIMLGKFGREESTFSKMPTSDLRSPNVEYGDLNLNFMPPGGVFERQIRPDPAALEGHVWTKDDFEKKYFDKYYAFDDDFVRSEPYKETKKQCRRVSWHRNYEPNCNTFHEIEIMKGDNRKIGNGSYRDVFLLHEPFDPDLVVKVNRYKRNPFTMDRYEFIRMDALVMERLTASPRIADIYGHCATSINSEFLPKEIEGMIIPTEGEGSDIKEGGDVQTFNDLTPSMRLDISLQMAESIADLHGFKDGVLVHDDVQLVQFLFTPDGRLKLNDFNRAEAMLFDEKDGSYCKYQNGKGGGEYRAPEEYKDDWLNEKIDIWSYGNNIYSMLTGLWPFYGNEQKELEKKMIDGETAFFDPRYRGQNYIHDQLIEIMEKCWIYDADERIDIFEIVKVLRGVKVEAQRQGIYEESSLL